MKVLTSTDHLMTSSSAYIDRRSTFVYTVSSEGVMIFNDPTLKKSFKVAIKSMKLTDKGGIRMKARDASRPDDEPGFMTFSSKEVARMRKIINGTET